MQLLVSAEGELFREFAISPDGEKLAIGKDPWLEVRDLQTGKVEAKFRHTYGIADFAFSASGRWLAGRMGTGDIFSSLTSRIQKQFKGSYPPTEPTQYQLTGSRSGRMMNT